VPRASVLLLSYNTRRWLREAVEGALAQSVPCRIILSDDASPDGSGELLEDLAATLDHGPHEVRLFRNPVNLGLGAHLSARMDAVVGDAVVMMAGDDISLPERVAQVLACFDADPDVMVTGGSYRRMDADGRDLGAGRDRLPPRFDAWHFARAGRFTTLLGAAMAFRPQVYHRFGPLTAVVEDNALTMRGMLLGEGVRLDTPLIRYRTGAGSLSGWVFARDGGPEAFVRRYRRLARMYRDVADDLDHALADPHGLRADRVRAGRRLAAMYRLEAEQREAMLDAPRRAWVGPIARGLWRPGLRRKSAERALKLVMPRRWIGLPPR
jgi:glycosyltransferase involved in cell wall biosynthesis